MKITEFKLIAIEDSHYIVEFTMHRWLRKPKECMAFKEMYTTRWFDLFTGKEFNYSVRQQLSNLLAVQQLSNLLAVQERLKKTRSNNENY